MNQFLITILDFGFGHLPLVESAIKNPKLQIVNRMIVHLDADAFFASVEQAADPRLRGKMVAVGGEKRGIIASASYEARRCGVYTPMPTVRARKVCPKLIVLPGDFEKYERFSRWMFSYAYDFTPDVEIGSIDEGYFDVSGHRKPPVEIAEAIRRAIGQSLKITVSEGIGSNKLVSQIASKLNKPAAFLNVPSGEEMQFLHPLPNYWLPGVGPKTSQRLNAAGLATVRQIAGTPTELLSLLVGRAAAQLKHHSNGIDERPVMPRRAAAKSYGHQETFGEDQTNEDLIEAVLRRMADRLMARVREDGKRIRTLTVKVRYNDMAEDQCGESLTEPTDLETDIYSRLRVLLRQAWKRRVSLRLVSLRFTNIYDSFSRTELALDDGVRQRDAQRRLAEKLDELRKTHGQRSVFRGHDFTLKTATEGRKNGKSKPASRQSVKYPAAKDEMPAVLKEEVASYRISVTSTPDSLRPDKGRKILTKGNRAPENLRRGLGQACVAQSYYSFLDSTLSVEAIVDWAKKEGVPSIALTDAGNLHGVVPFVQAARAAGIKPILGASVRVDGTTLRLIVEKKAGYQNLCRILSSPAIANKYTGEDLKEMTDGLIAVGSEPQWAEFFPGRFYLGISDPRQLRRLGHLSLPKVASVPVRHADREDRWKYDVVQSIRTLTLLRQAHPEKQLDGEFHFRSFREMTELFAGHPDLLERCGEIAERCEFELEFGAPQFPDFKPPDGSPPRVFLRKIVFTGARKRYPGHFEQVVPQLEQELSIIGEVGYEEYFLVMWDILRECRRHGIEWITRGSAADSLVCYCLEISGVCPIRFELYFRRFLNKERMALNKLPDIDVDFPHDRKDDVIDLIFEKYGPEHTAVVGGFSTYHARSALGDVGKVLGVSEYQIRRLTHRLPHTYAHQLSQVVANNRECADQPFEEEPYKSGVQMAQFLSGFPRYRKMHPCGLVMSRQPMKDLVPTFESQKGYPTTHFDMDAVETIGLVKMDILAQGGLAVMRDVWERIGGREEVASLFSFSCSSGKPRSHNRNQCTTDQEHDHDPGDEKDGDDAKVWEMIAGGGGRAVHHIESPAMVSLCRMCNVRDIDTLIAIVSVIRPGAANESRKTEFARRYQGLSPVAYPHPSLEPCLKSTFGLVVYEEHILQMCELFAGLPAGRADVLRRALAKEKEDVVDEIAREFVVHARARGRSEKSIKEVLKLVTGFRGYAFCKAHSTAYGVEAYEAAWLKLNYPTEFMAAVLSNGKGFYSPLVYVLECHRLGIRMWPPCVNEPGPDFVPHANTGGIRVPATRVKGLTTRTREKMISERSREKFASMGDFFRRVHPTAEEMESLIRVGVFDGFGKTRTAQFWECRFHQCAYGPGDDQGQGWLLPPPATDSLPQEVLEEPTRRQCLLWETELLDFCASGHPLELYEDVKWDSYCSVVDLGKHIGETVVTCGLVIEQRVHHQVTGEPMKFLTLADWTGMVETELFAATYRNYGLATIRYPVLEVLATVEPFENGNGFSLRVRRAGKARS